MKKNLMFSLSIIILILSFLKNWYSIELLDLLFSFYIIPNIILFLIFNICLIKIIENLRKEKLFINYVSLVILMITVLLFLFFPFREFKFKYEFNKYEKSRLEIVEKTRKFELVPYDKIGNIKLPKEYKKYSLSGEVFVYQNDENGVVIGFWILRGIQSGSIELIYSTGDEQLIRKNETGHPIVSIKKIKENWFYVKTDY